MMSETLAEYSALMVMKQKYGADQMHRFLRHELDRYLRGQSTEVRHEPPLALVQREPYVWYQKGGQIMYTLADYIGEDKVNLALHNFLMQYRYANANTTQTERYPDTRQLVAALRAQTPEELQYLIDDGFDSIVLYDNKATSATVTPTNDHQYKVTLQVQARKVKLSPNYDALVFDDNVLVAITGKTGTGIAVIALTSVPEPPPPPYSTNAAKFPQQRVPRPATPRVLNLFGRPTPKLDSRGTRIKHITNQTVLVPQQTAPRK